MSKKKILVTGGTGFIGSHLVESLVREGHDIRCLVRKTSRIRHLKKLGVELCIGDITEYHSLVSPVKDVDIVYHLAALVRFPFFSRKNLINLHKINVQGTRKLLEACTSVNIEKFIYFSSSAVIGPLKDLPVNETVSCHPKTPYGKSKYEGEKLVLRYGEERKLPFAILRPTVVYGPGHMNSCILKIGGLLKNHFCPVIGNGNLRVPLVYINDVVRAAMLAGKCRKNNRIYLVSNERAYTLNEVVQIIGDELNLRFVKIHLPLPLAKTGLGILEFFSSSFGFELPFDPKMLAQGNLLISSDQSIIYDISLAKNELGYEPKIDLKEGLKRSIRWYKKNGYL